MYEGYSKESLICLLIKKDNRITDIENQLSDYSWRLNPDRMGGSFSQQEIDEAKDNKLGYY